MRVPLVVRVVPAFAARAWFTPPPLSPKREARWEESRVGSERVVVEVDGVELAGLTYGEGPLVFLFHGWGGRAAQMAPLAKAIAGRGFHTVAINAPGHGDGRKTSDIFQMAKAIEILVEQIGRPEAVVAHSLGSMAAVHAFRGSMPNSIVLLAPVLDVEVALEKFIERAQLRPWVARSLISRVRSFVGDAWDGFSSGYRTEFGDADLLLVHDPADDDAPFEVSAAIAATRGNTSLLLAESTGHSGALQASTIAEDVADFLSRSFPGSGNGEVDRAEGVGEISNV